MIADHLTDIEQFDADLWKVANDLRANSNLASNEYFMPIMGLLFLRQATNRYYEARAAIEADKAAGKMPDRPLVEADFTRRRAMMLPEAARYDVILNQPKDGKLGEALTAAMEAVEEHFAPLAGQLPKYYEHGAVGDLAERMRQRLVMREPEGAWCAPVTFPSDLEGDRKGRQPGSARRREVARELAVEIRQHVPADPLGHDIGLALVVLGMLRLHHGNALHVALDDLCQGILHHGLSTSTRQAEGGTGARDGAPCRNFPSSRAPMVHRTSR